MKKIRYILSFALALCLFCSCANEEEVNPPATGKRTSKLRITVGKLKTPAASGTVKSSENMSATEGLSVIWGGPMPATRQGGLANDQEVFDLLIAQFLPLRDDEGKLINVKIIGTPQYYTSTNPRFQPDYADEDAYTILDFEYLDAESSIIGIANLSDPDFFDTDAIYDAEQWYKKLLLTYDSEADVTKDGKIIMVGGGSISPGNSSPYMDLIHMVSKINLTVNYTSSGFSGGTLKINSVQLLSVPKMNSIYKMNSWDRVTYRTDQNSYNNHQENYVFPPVTEYYLDINEYYQENDYPRFSQLYPHDHTDELFMKYPAVEEDIPSESNFVWYMPEHLRGDNHQYSISNPKLKYWKYDPSYLETAEFNGEGISYATRIEIKGIYTPSVGKKQNVKFTIYPGRYDDSSYNNYDYTHHNNFDIDRNYCYNIIVNIKSLDGDDKRIEVTDIIEDM